VTNYFYLTIQSNFNQNVTYTLNSVYDISYRYIVKNICLFCFDSVIVFWIIQLLVVTMFLVRQLLY